MPWSRVAVLPAINRLCAPGSELAIEQRWYPSAARDDLLEIEEGKINGTRLYRCLDRILPHKTKLERHLMVRRGYSDHERRRMPYLSGDKYTIGSAPQGHHRPDCEQLVVALIVNNEGFQAVRSAVWKLR